jgi:Tfp pilus assembly protein PilO
VIAALVLVTVLLGTWYVHARIESSAADEEMERVSTQIAQLRTSQAQNSKAGTIKKQNESIAAQLKKLLAEDLPWATLTDEIRATGTTAGVQVSSISGSLTDTATVSSALPSTTSARTVASLQITGSGPDKATIAGFVDDLGDLSDLASPYLTSATQTKDGMTFTLSAQVAATALCGRFTTECKGGGK